MTLTRAGGFYIAVTLLVGFAAVNTGNNLLFLMVSALLGFMAVSGVAGWLNIRGLSVALELPDEVYAGCDTLLTVRFTNRKRRLPSFLLRVRLAGREVLFPLVEKEGSSSVPVRFERRGVQRIERVELCSPFPVGFFIRCRDVTAGAAFLVFPFPRPCRGGAEEARKRERGVAPARHGGYDGELARIGAYTGSEPLKSIHWRLSARQDELLVKEFSALVGEPVVIDLERLAGNLEERLSCAAFLVNRLFREQRPVGLRLQGKLIPPALSNSHRLRLLAELASYG